MDDRRLTFIIVPDGDLETRRVDITFRKLKWLIRGASVLLLVFIVMAATWFYLATQVAQVPGLKREVHRLEAEQQKLAELARTLAEVEAQYERVRELLGADGAAGGTPSLPPLRAPEGTDTAGRVTRPLGFAPDFADGPALRLRLANTTRAAERQAQRLNRRLREH